MPPARREPTHPGLILREELLEPLGATQVELAAHIGVPLQRVNEIVRGRRGVRPETAWLFAAAPGTTPQLPSNQQSACDLAASRPARTIRPLRRTGRDELTL